MNSGNCLDDYTLENISRSNEDRREMTIFFIDFLFPYALDIILGIIYDDELLIAQSFFNELPP